MWAILANDGYWREGCGNLWLVAKSSRKLYGTWVPTTCNWCMKLEAVLWNSPYPWVCTNSRPLVSELLKCRSHSCCQRAGWWEFTPTTPQLGLQKYSVRVEWYFSFHPHPLRFSKFRYLMLLQRQRRNITFSLEDNFEKESSKLSQFYKKGKSSMRSHTCQFSGKSRFRICI